MSRLGLWCGLALLTAGPVAVALANPLLAGRDAIYVTASLAGILALVILLVQPLLAGGMLPGIGLAHARRIHRVTGVALITAVAAHVGGLYLTSPPDALDALLLASPTPFSVYGVIAMWGVVLTGLSVMLRRRFKLRPGTWAVVHNGLALVVVGATVVHAVQIEGLMGPLSKWVLCLAALAAVVGVTLYLRVIRPRGARRGS